MKKKTILSIFLATIISLSSFFAINSTVYADDSYGTVMNITPMWQKIILRPGEEYRSTIKLTNIDTATEDLDYSLSVGSFSQHGSDNSVDDYSDMDFITRNDYNQIVDWISFDHESGSVAPGDSVSIPFTINVPDDAPAGGQYASILITNNSTKSTSGAVAIKTVPQMASIIYAEVAGDTIEKGAISENNIPSFVTDGKLEATSRVKNEGNVHTDAKFVLQVWPMFSDEEICTNEEAEDNTKLIMPETEKYMVQTCELPAIGIFKAKQTVTLFGESSEVEKTVIACPIWLLFIIIFAIVALIIWIVLRAKSRKNKRAEA